MSREIIAIPSYPRINPSTGSAYTIKATYEWTGAASGQYGFSVSGSRTFMSGGHLHRICCPGTVIGCRISLLDTTNLTSLVFRVVRQDSDHDTSWHTVNSSEAILAAALAPGWNTITFATPITGVQAGDCFAVCLNVSGANGSLDGKTGLTIGDHKVYWQDDDATVTLTWWGGSTDGGVLMMSPTMAAPIVSIAGDSFAGGHDPGHSQFEPLANWPQGAVWTYVTWNTDIGYWLWRHDPILFRYCLTGWGSKKSIDWATAGTGNGDMIVTYGMDLNQGGSACYPRACILSLGANDAGDSVSPGDYLTNMTNIFDELLSNDCTPIMLTPILTSTSSSGLLETYTKAIIKLCEQRDILCINAMKLMQGNQTGIARNSFWGADSHPNSDGYAAVANAIASHIVPQS